MIAAALFYVIYFSSFDMTVRTIAAGLFLVFSVLVVLALAVVFSNFVMHRAKSKFTILNLQSVISASEARNTSLKSG